MESGFAADFERERARYADGESRVGAIADPDERQRQLTRMGNAAAGAGLALLMDGRRDEAREWLARAAGRYRESFVDAPPGSWGRPIGAMKARLLAGDRSGAEDDARWALDAGAADSDSPIGRYAGCLALLVLARDGEARELVESIEGRDDFPPDVAAALRAIATTDKPGYASAIGLVLRSFEARDHYLEDVPVADTVLVLQELATRSGIAVRLGSLLLPGRRDPALGSDHD
jgi:hypothetical protein